MIVRTHIGHLLLSEVYSMNMTFRELALPSLRAIGCHYTDRFVTTLLCYNCRHQIACFRVTAKSYNVSTRTVEPRRVKTTLNSQRSKARNAVLLTWSRAERGGGEKVLPWP
jgi:hypothetical protein